MLSLVAGGSGAGWSLAVIGGFGSGTTRGTCRVKVVGGAHDRWISSDVTRFAVRFCGEDGTAIEECYL